MSKIIVIGGTGILGSELSKLDKNLILLNSDYDIFHFKKLEEFLENENPDVIVNLVSVKSEKVDDDPIDALNINLIGASNLAKYCIQKQKRLIYVSTDYVYEGTVGNYNEESSLLPFNNYAWTKLAGEVSARLVKDHLIIRTSFCKNDFTYRTSYTNYYTNKDYVDKIASIVLKLFYSELKGIINVGTDKKSVYDMIKSRTETLPQLYKETKDFSMNLKKLKEYERELRNKGGYYNE